jgi:hypothetical protein
MNRILKRPMFRIGGSAGTGITSGLDKPRKQYAQGSEDRFMELVAELREQGFTQQEAIEEARRRLDMAKGGRVGYANGTGMPNFQPSGIPGFLTGLGLNLLATPPQGNIFQTIGTAAQDPFNRLQAQQASLMKTASDRAFAKELAQEEREFEEKQLGRRLAVEREKIDKMGGGDLLKRIESAKENYGGNEIKAAREIDFYDNKFTELQGNYGDQGVFIDPVDLSVYESQKNGLEKFVKQNPQAGRQVVYDVATGKAVRIVKDPATGKLKAVPADSSDIDATGENMPKPVVRNPGYLREPKKVDLEEPDFGIGFYD